MVALRPSWHALAKVSMKFFPFVDGKMARHYLAHRGVFGYRLQGAATIFSLLPTFWIVRLRTTLSTKLALNGSKRTVSTGYHRFD